VNLLASKKVSPLVCRSTAFAVAWLIASCGSDPERADIVRPDYSALCAVSDCNGHGTCRVGDDM
jgi:hypothetical protein